MRRYQELKATEITTTARTMRANALPSMAIELEERAEAIERQFRMGLIEEDTEEETEAVNTAREDLRKHVLGAREAVLADNEQFLKSTSDDFHRIRGEVLRARANYLNVDMSLDSNASVSVDEGRLGGPSLSTFSVKSLTSDFESLQEKFKGLGGKLVDAMLERLLFKYEVKEARVNRAKRAKDVLENRDNGNDNNKSNNHFFCPTCKPLLEANLELRKVADKKKGEREDREKERERNGDGGHSNRSRRKAKAGGVSVDEMRSRYPGLNNLSQSLSGSGGERGQNENQNQFQNQNQNQNQNLGYRDDDDESVISTASSREAEFVQRFLGKVSKNAGTLSHTLNMLTKGDDNGSNTQNQNFYDSNQNQNDNNHKHLKEHENEHNDLSTFDEAIAQTLESSRIGSHTSIDIKHKADRHLVKSLLHSQGGRADANESVESANNDSNSSFLFEPVEASAGALSEENVQRMVDNLKDPIL